MKRSIALVILLLSACSRPGSGPYPSLRPRAAENIDPRLQPVRPMNDRPVASALAAQLDSLVERARVGEAAFQPAMASAERLAASAGAAHSEGWVAAQQALSAAVAARRPTATALADIDALGATALQIQGGIAPKDLAAINAAAAEVASIDRAQTARVEAVQRRLGSS